MKRDTFRLTLVRVRLQHFPLERFSPHTLPELFAALTHYHQFEDYMGHGDEGATFVTEGLRELSIERDRITLEQNVQVGFDAIRKDFTDIIGTVREHLHIPLFSSPRVLLRGLWPLPSPELEAAKELLERCTKLNDDQFKMLQAEGLDAVGLTVNATLAGGRHVLLRIRPTYEYADQLFIELDGHEHSFVQTIEVISEQMEQYYTYLWDQVLSFVATFMP